MRKTLFVLTVILLVFAIIVPVFAEPPPDEGSSPGHSDGAPGEERASANCRATWDPESQPPQTPSGQSTGSAHDPKQIDSGVSNCDQFWTDGVEPGGDP